MLILDEITREVLGEILLYKLLRLTRTASATIALRFASTLAQFVHVYSLPHSVCLCL